MVSRPCSASIVPTLRSGVFVEVPPLAGVDTKPQLENATPRNHRFD
jgi:hypothetical protein